MRFRSSSNVEDAQGFNGAGLYDSNSGYLAPEAQPDPDERKKSIEWALKKTWASYWSAEAFEERRTALVPHLEGAMAVVVHAEFSDALEAANGVLTLTLRHDGGNPLASMVVDSQPGAESVTNPSTPGALPEVVVVERAATGASPTLQRVRASTVTTNGAPVLTDDELLRLFEAASAVAETWLEAGNAGVPAVKADRVVTLDFEHRRVLQGWPAVGSGLDYPSRLVLKQVRSLDPAVHPVVAALGLPAPRDVLSRARRVERRSCVSPGLQFSETVVYTDPNRLPDLGFSERPFTATLVVVLAADVPELGLAKGHRTDLDHTQLASITRPDAQGMSILATLSATAAAAAGFTELEGRVSTGEWRLSQGTQTASGTGLQCTTTALYSSPEDYLLSLLAGQ
ncbi:MAG: PEP/pyruvate-binding domain-containing protein [Myxococcales bacterium]